jgi:hypothetical protein
VGLSISILRPNVSIGHQSNGIAGRWISVAPLRVSFEQQMTSIAQELASLAQQMGSIARRSPCVL